MYTVPQDSRLPDGGGYALTFYDIKPRKFNQFDNFRTFKDNAGGAFNHFNGVDFTVNARLRQSVVQGGLSTGNVVEDECGVATQHAETQIFAPWGGTQPFFGTFVGGLGQYPQAFCHRESGWQTNVKGLVTYNVPKIDVLISGTFHSLPYSGNNFPSVASQSLGAQAIVAPLLNTSLGRPLSSGNFIEFLNLVKPGVMYGDRLNAIDFRIGKNVKYGVTFLPNFGAGYLNPLSITGARLAKISVQFDF